MRIIDDDREHAFTGKCENCGRDGISVRRVEVYSHISRASRGYYSLCYDCWGPHIKWVTKDGRTVESPISRDTKKQKGKAGRTTMAGAL